MKTLFLDDSKERTKFFKQYFPNAKCVETAKECIEKLSEEDWDVVFLDHDLGGKVMVSESELETGSEVVRWIKNNKPKVKAFILHSLNFPARENMYKNLLDCGYKVKEIPFIQISIIFKKSATFDLFVESLKDCYKNV